MELHHFIGKTTQIKISQLQPDESVNYTGFKGKFTHKASWSEMKEPTKTRRSPLKYLF